MPKLLERCVGSADERLLLLAPPHATVPDVFENVVWDRDEHRRRVRELQQLRGGIYLKDGAVRQSDLSKDGLHHTPEDDQSWHVLMLDEHDNLSSCIWFLEHENSVSLEHLRVRHCPLGLREESREPFRQAIDGELGEARREGIKYAESGGWAVRPESRCSTEGLILALAAFSLGTLLGGVRALSTATSRHKSSTILQRLGGSLLSADSGPLSAYFDPKYKCWMELLRFDSRRPNPRYMSLIDSLAEKLASAMVIGRQAIASVPDRIPARVQAETMGAPAIIAA